MRIETNEDRTATKFEPTVELTHAHANTAEKLRELTLDTTRRYQPQKQTKT